MAPRPPERTLLSWSGGKDSALALQALRADAAVRVDALVTTVTDSHDRVSMHGVRRALLEQQADALGVPLRVVRIPPACTNADYEAAFGAALIAWAGEGGSAVAFGDLFLADVRAYREQLVAAHAPRLAARYPHFAASCRLKGCRSALSTVPQVPPEFFGSHATVAVAPSWPV